MAAFVGTQRICSLPTCEQPCFREPDGIVHSYCSRTCSNEALARAKWASLRTGGGGGGASSRSSTSAPRCQLSGCSLTVYIEETTRRVHNYCGRRHANLAASNILLPGRHADLAAAAAPSRSGDGDGDGDVSLQVPAPVQTKGKKECTLEGCRELVYRDPVTTVESEYCSNRHYVMGTALLNRECIRDGCRRAAWVDEDTGDVLDYCGSRCARDVGMPHLVGQGECSLPGCVNPNLVHPHTQKEMGYCCEDHRLRATQRSLGPNPERHVDRTFRGGTTSADDFQLSVLTNRHPEYTSRKEQFLQAWAKPTDVSIKRMFKVKVPEDIRRKTERHMGQVGNVKRRFHGTSCSDMCTFFVDLRGGPCGESTCNVCSICTHGFQLRDNVGGTATRTNFDLRYGEGLYFSSVSGKANDYAELSEKTDRSGKKVRCMFLSSVAIGRAFTTTQGRLEPADNLCPPPGFDSVVGEPGVDLNYPEVVVYREEAALPTHLVVYTLRD